jgi:hypothetical protein
MVLPDLLQQPSLTFQLYLSILGQADHLSGEAGRIIIKSTI